MKTLEELKARFASIQDLPVSEEMIGAYIEGNLSENDSRCVEIAMSEYDDCDFLSELISIAPMDIDFLHNEEIENVTEQINDIMFEIEEIGDINLNENVGGCLYEAQKQFGLEPINVEFDPNTYQWEADTCAIRSQEIVLRSFGKFVSQEELITQAENNGWYSKGFGTSIENVGNLLDLHGVPNHRIADANIFNLVDELGHGHKVIVAVDVNELYGNSFWQSIKEFTIGQTPNHAMLVSGINTADPNNPTVILTDPGTGKTLFECPYNKFLSAWDDSKCFMVATNNPAPLEYNIDTMMNFDYEKGCVSNIGKIPFDHFHENIMSEADSYINSLDEYIDSVENMISNGFDDNSYEKVIHQENIAHQNAEKLKSMNDEIGNNETYDEDLEIEEEDSLDTEDEY